MKEFKIHFEVPSDTSYISFVRQLLPALSKCDIHIPARTVRRGTICLVEAFDNAVLHAHKGKPSANVGIELAMSRGRLSMKVRDAGKGFDLKRIPEPTLYQISGRGIFIIRNIAEKVVYRDNTLAMEVKIR